MTRSKLRPLETPRQLPPPDDPVLAPLYKLRRLPKPCVIWRYMNLYEFLVLATHKQLIFRQFRELVSSDKREGQVPLGFWESWEKEMRKQIADDNELLNWKERTVNTLNVLQCSMYASCWSRPRDRSCSESAVMWKAYALRGIAVRSEVEKLRAAKLRDIPEMGDIGLQCHPIVYADDWNQLKRRGLTAELVLNRLFLHTKRNAFADENEVRFSFQLPGPYYNLYAQQCPAWFPVCFEDLKWIDEIVAESSLAEWAVQIVEHLAHAHGLPFRPSKI
jgi:hypothetical protein